MFHFYQYFKPYFSQLSLFQCLHSSLENLSWNTSVYQATCCYSLKLQCYVVSSISLGNHHNIYLLIYILVFVVFEKPVNTSAFIHYYLLYFHTFFRFNQCLSFLPGFPTVFFYSYFEKVHLCVYVSALFFKWLVLFLLSLWHPIYSGPRFISHFVLLCLLWSALLSNVKVKFTWCFSWGGGEQPDSAVRGGHPHLPCWGPGVDTSPWPVLSVGLGAGHLPRPHPQDTIPSHHDYTQRLAESYCSAPNEPDQGVSVERNWSFKIQNCNKCTDSNK